LGVSRRDAPSAGVKGLDAGGRKQRTGNGRKKKQTTAFARERRQKETGLMTEGKRRRGLLACFFLHLRLTRGSYGCKLYSMRRVEAYPRGGGGSIVLVLCT
jgi:hypothetical protein